MKFEQMIRINVELDHKVRCESQEFPAFHKSRPKWTVKIQ